MEIQQPHGVLEWAKSLKRILDLEPDLLELAGQYLHIACRTRFMLLERMGSLLGKSENVLQCRIVLMILTAYLTISFQSSIFIEWAAPSATDTTLEVRKDSPIICDSLTG